MYKYNEKCFSLVIPTYNNEKTLPGTLKSIGAMNEKDKIDLIISDDASLDNTVPIIQEWINSHGNEFHSIKFIKNKNNSGISGNHKIAFSQVETKYGMYLGGDDLLYNPNLIIDIMKELNDRPIEIAKISLETLELPANKVQNLYESVGGFFELGFKSQFAKLSLFDNFLYAGPGTVLNIEILHEINAFDESFRSFEDFPLFLNFIIHGFQIKRINCLGLYWVRSENSLSATGFKAMKTEFANDLIKIEAEYIRKHPELMTPWLRVLLFIKKNRFLQDKMFKIHRKLFGYPN